MERKAMPDDKLNIAQSVIMRELQDAIDLLPPGPLRDYRQSQKDRVCARLDGMPARVAAKLHTKSDHDNVTDLAARQEIIRALTASMMEHLNTVPLPRKPEKGDADDL
jgi:hypothetical protein